METTKPRIYPLIKEASGLGKYKITHEYWTACSEMGNYSPSVHKQVSTARQAGKQPSKGEMEQLSQVSDESYSGSRLPHQHDTNQKGNKL